MSIRGVRTGLFVALLAAGSRVSSQAPGDPVTYSEDQAARGEQVFSKVCVECHTRKDMATAVFRVKWNGRTVFDLFERIRSTMPESNPGELPRGQYLDVTTYLAKINGIPAGAVDLPDDDTRLRKQLLALPPQTSHQTSTPSTGSGSTSVSPPAVASVTSSCPAQATSALAGLGPRHMAQGASVALPLQRPC